MSGSVKTKSLRLFLELSVIVVGVLIALAGESLWETREEGEREMEYVLALGAELQEGKRLVDEHITTIATYVEQLDTFFAVVRSGRPAADSPITGILMFSTIVPTGTLDALVSTGDVRLLRDSHLRAAVIREQAQISSDRWVIDRWGDRLTENMSPFWVENLKTEVPQGGGRPVQLVLKARANREFQAVYRIHWNHLRNQIGALRRMRESFDSLSMAVETTLSERR